MAREKQLASCPSTDGTAGGHMGGASARSLGGRRASGLPRLTATSCGTSPNQFAGRSVRVNVRATIREGAR